MSETSGMNGQVVLVTGVTGNVGWGLAHAAREAGASLVLPVRSAEAEAAVAKEFGGERALIRITDTGSEASVEGLREEAVARFGRVDHVFASMGAWWQKGASLEQPTSELGELLHTYAEAQHLFARVFAPTLGASGGSFTIVTGSAAEGFIPSAGLLVIAVSAQYAVSRVLRQELSQAPFRYNELRITCRIEREERPGVVPSRVAGQDFLALFKGAERGVLFRYPGAGQLSVTR